eukprot:6338485-Prymnesium_polylepis.1
MSATQASSAPTSSAARPSGCPCSAYTRSRRARWRSACRSHSRPWLCPRTQSAADSARDAAPAAPLSAR